MTQKTSSGAQSRTEAQRNLIVRVIRMSGGAFILAGLMVFFNIAGLGETISGLENDTNKIVGGAFMFVGLLDIIVLPRVFEQMQKK